jgi:hypothetical protein
MSNIKSPTPLRVPPAKAARELLGSSLRYDHSPRGGCYEYVSSTSDGYNDVFEIVSVGANGVPYRWGFTPRAVRDLADAAHAFLARLAAGAEDHSNSPDERYHRE